VRPRAALAGAQRARRGATHRFHFRQLQAQQAVDPGQQLAAADEERLVHQADRRRRHREGSGAARKRISAQTDFTDDVAVVQLCGAPERVAGAMSAAAPALPVLQVRLRREDESPLARLAVGGGGGGGASPPLPPAQRSAAEDDALLGRANALLAFVGLRARARCADDAVAVCARSSVFVAAVEAALGHRLEGTRPLADMTALDYTQSSHESRGC
jgi:hypothetical protein